MPGPATIRYGGNTSCVEVRGPGDHLLVLDAGTGIRSLGRSLDSCPTRIDILLSHLHLDHIEGLGFFDPLFDERCEVHVWGPGLGDRPLLEGLAAYFGPPIFPVPIHRVPASLDVREVPEGPFEVGPFRVLAERVEHPGPTLGYRVEGEGAALAYISDHEPAREPGLAAADPSAVSGARLAAGADLLVHDAQYTEHEYPERAGWGHSSVAHAVAFARLARARRLLLFHHDPGHADEDLDALAVRARELWGAGGDGVLVAAEGMEIEVAGP